MKRSFWIIFTGGVLMGLFAVIPESSRTSPSRALLLFFVPIATWALFLAALFFAIRLSAKPHLSPSERILLEEWGACLQDIGWVGGVLYLTSSRLYFRSHIFSRIRNFEINLSLNDVLEVSQEDKRLIIETEMFSSPIIFLLNNPSEWKSRLAENR